MADAVIEALRSILMLRQVWKFDREAMVTGPLRATKLVAVLEGLNTERLLSRKSMNTIIESILCHVNAVGEWTGQEGDR